MWGLFFAACRVIRRIALSGLVSVTDTPPIRQIPGPLPYGIKGRDAFAMHKIFRCLLRGDAGAVTIDWVVLVAAVVTLGLAVGVTVSRPANDLANDIGTTLESLAPKTY